VERSREKTRLLWGQGKGGRELLLWGANERKGNGKKNFLTGLNFPYTEKGMGGNKANRSQERVQREAILEMEDRRISNKKEKGVPSGITMGM